MAVANVSALLNPELVVLQSQYLGLLDLIVPRIDAMVEFLVPAKPRIVQSQLGNDAVLYGATVCVLRMSAASRWRWRCLRDAGRATPSSSDLYRCKLQP